MEKILVIDDDELSRALYRTVLEQKDYLVVDCENGTDGVDVYKGGGIDLVITDIFMEDKDGLEVIEELVAHDPNVKVFAITGAASSRIGAPDYLEMAKTCGARDVFAKPIDWKEMLSKLEEVLKAEMVEVTS